MGFNYRKCHQALLALIAATPLASSFAHPLDEIRNRNRKPMADFPYNIALGRAVQLYINVDTNAPAASVLTVIIINTTATDATLRDLDTVALVIADANTAEANNTNYVRKDLTDSELSAFAPDDANDRTDLDFPDQSWTAVAGDGSPNAWTDAVVCYEPDGGSPADANKVPISQHDFPVTPDGSDINLTTPNGFYRAAAA